MPCNGYSSRAASSALRRRTYVFQNASSLLVRSMDYVSLKDLQMSKASTPPTDSRDSSLYRQKKI
ncbi:uncharacterized protein EKO05_0002725 [Ascochyta rabiei]|uniref:uncharacterized protein n=1 Tax=Didymella rabiei TaxID=5454 RepID=UPI0021FB6CDA|nr:uncharacterized protein EKO05_0002725 [Ascochyta rabiei]UPX12159.1 hypothetical protein EKO05_0002725 [Ascochyta rabiei]